MTLTIRHSCLAALPLAVLLGHGTPHAQPAPKPDGLWHGSLGAGLSMASGNTRTSALNLNGETARETASDKITLYGLVLRADSKQGGVTTKSADLLRLGGRYDRALTDRLFGYAGLEFEKDDLQDLRLRSAGTIGLGYKVLRTPDTTFDVFGGIGYLRNDFKTGRDTDGATLQFGEESTHKLTTSASFKQRLVVYPGLESSLGNRATWDATLATAIAGGWSLNVTYALRYFSKAPAGVKSTDSLLMVGAGYKF